MAIQDKFNKANVIYKITKDIDLGGETLTIPEGCTLDFQGGSFSNGIVVGNNTNIVSALIKIFDSIIIKGSWNVLDIYSDWFSSDENTLLNLVSLNKETIPTNIYINGNYLLVATIGVVSNTNVFINGVITKSDSLPLPAPIIEILSAHNVTIKGSLLRGNKNGQNTEYGHGVRINGSKNIKIQCCIENCTGDGVYITTDNGECNNIEICNTNIKNCGRNGISIIGGENINIYNIFISDFNTKMPMSAIDLEPNSASMYIKNVNIRNIITLNCVQGILVETARNNNIHEVTIDNWYYESASGRYAFEDTSTGQVKVLNSRIISNSAAVQIIPFGYFNNCYIESNNYISGIFTNCKIVSTNNGGVFNSIATSFIDCNITCTTLSEGNTQTQTTNRFIMKGCSVTMNNGQFKLLTNNIVEPIIEDNIFNMQSYAYPFNFDSFARGKFNNNIINILSANRNLIQILNAIDAEVRNNIVNISEGIDQNVFAVSGSNTCIQGNIINHPSVFTKKDYLYSNTITSVTNKVGDFIFYNDKPVWWTGSKWVDATGADV